MVEEIFFELALLVDVGLLDFEELLLRFALLLDFLKVRFLFLDSEAPHDGLPKVVGDVGELGHVVTFEAHIRKVELHRVGLVTLLLKVDLLLAEDALSGLEGVIEKGVVVLSEHLAFVVDHQLVLEVFDDSLQFFLIVLEILSVHVFSQVKRV